MDGRVVARCGDRKACPPNAEVSMSSKAQLFWSLKERRRRLSEQVRRSWRCRVNVTYCGMQVRPNPPKRSVFNTQTRISRFKPTCPDKSGYLRPSSNVWGAPRPLLALSGHRPDRKCRNLERAPAAVNLAAVGTYSHS